MSEGGQGLSMVDKPSESHDTRAEIAKVLDWSTGKVAQADYVAKRADEDTKNSLRRGQTTINLMTKQLVYLFTSLLVTLLSSATTPKKHPRGWRVAW